MFDRSFRHRPGRVTGLSRLLLAAVTLAAMWADPGHPLGPSYIGYAVPAGYFAWAIALLAIGWGDWWRDFRLALPAHLIDLAAFGAVVALSRGHLSPFYVFALFLMLSAQMRWSWRGAARTSVAIFILFAAAGVISTRAGAPPLQPQELLVSFAYLILLSVLVVWFGLNQVDQPDSASNVQPRPDLDELPIELAVWLAARRTGAHRIVLLWWGRDDPRPNVYELVDEKVERNVLAAGTFDGVLPDSPDNSAILFDRARGRALRQSGNRLESLPALDRELDPAFAERYGLDQGLAVRLRARDFDGELFALNVDGLCAHDLRVTQALANEITNLLDRHSMLAALKETAVDDAQLKLARDVHDSVAQSLVGASFRLEALKAGIKSGADPEASLKAVQDVKDDLANEQRQIRQFITHLRGGRDSPGGIDLCANMETLARQLGSRWEIRCDVQSTPAEIQGPAWMEYDLHQIVREAAANAVRHGKAKHITIEMTRIDSDLALEILEFGGIAPIAGEASRNGSPEKSIEPWSLQERVRSLGGSMFFSNTNGSRLKILIPLETSQ